jgi:hypothetical protein
MIHYMINLTTVDDATYNSDVIYPQRLKDEAGILQHRKQAGTASIQLKGRVHPDSAWSDIGSAITSTAGHVEDIPIFPEMMVTVVTSGGAGANTVKVWLAE